MTIPGRRRRMAVVLTMPLWMWSADALSGTWSDLWWTPDQQGQRLLDSHQPEAAARQFSDPRRRGFAELQAGHYEDAAKRLAPFKDETSEYNRGNALAHAGHLQEALAAYDTVLKTDPRNRDARHNRDLVARALQQQHPPQQHGNQQQGGGSSGSQAAGSGSQNGSGSQGSGSQRSGSPADGAQQAGAQPQTAQSQGAGRNSSAGSSANGAQTDGGQRGGQQGAAGSNSSNDPAGNSNGTTSAGSTAGQQAADNGTRGGSAQNGSSSNDAAQAQRDAAAGADNRRRQQQAGGGATAGGDQSAGTDSRSVARATPDPNGLKPQSEQSLAQEQWLRRIPEDPGGLLRRKFLIEHMLQQQANER